MLKIKSVIGPKYFLWKLLLIIIGLTVLALYFVSSSRKGGDFVTFLEASTKMWEGKNIYAPPYINLRYSYSPFWAMLLIPFALLPTGVGAFVWLVLCLGFFIRTIWLLRNHFQIKINDYRLDRILWVFVLLYISRYLELNFHHVQMTVFLLWICLEALYYCNKPNELAAGILIGLGSVIKIMPVVMIPYFIYRKRLVLVATSLITITICFFLPFVFTGGNMFWEMNKDWYSIIRPDSPEFQSEVSWHLPQNLSLLVYKLFVDTGAPYSWPILHLSYDKATVISWAIIATLVILTLYFLKTLPFIRIYDRRHQIYEVSYILLLIPLIFPHQMKYAFYFTFPAISCLSLVLVDTYRESKSNNVYKATLVILILSFLLCTATTDLLIGMPFSTITQHLKTITIGTLLLIPALAMNRDYFVSDK